VDIFAGDLAFALDLADVADSVTLPRFRAADLRISVKGDESHVTDADEAAERAIREAVVRSGRGELVLGEEAGGAEAADVRWIVDPIDGTSSFARGIPIWATLLALERDGETTIGVASAPALGRRWWATRGGGAFAGGSPCRVSTVSRIEDATISTGSVRRMPPGWFEIARRAAGNRGLGPFWQHCLVAEGALDVGTDWHMRLWDHAAVRLIVEEAGGRCTTWDGAAPFDGCTLLSTNGLLHDDVVAAMRDR
jgi:histidinol-phosphatase